MTCSASFYVMLPGSWNPPLVTWSPSQLSHPKKTSSASEKYLNRSELCALSCTDFAGFISLTCYCVVEENDQFTLEFLKQVFSEGRASRFFISGLPRPPKRDVPPEYFPQARPFIPGRILRPAINKLGLHLPLTEGTPG